ncbi:hypothetical protein B0H17DRAFT_1149679 [Mycena rosella]|uniref:Uncharacterized protein n=1 Tax=Mycena rosella TaxID=1033263 RepID=A0AAD7C0S0_MYCRO|nr:hypothetical protein B0H17DRAFT_1149679 [Mycena rosella]
MYQDWVGRPYRKSTFLLRMPSEQNFSGNGPRPRLCQRYNGKCPRDGRLAVLGMGMDGYKRAKYLTCASSKQVAYQRQILTVWRSIFLPTLYTYVGPECSERRSMQKKYKTGGYAQDMQPQTATPRPGTPSSLEERISDAAATNVQTWRKQGITEMDAERKQNGHGRSQKAQRVIGKAGTELTKWTPMRRDAQGRATELTRKRTTNQDATACRLPNRIESKPRIRETMKMEYYLSMKSAYVQR